MKPRILSSIRRIFFEPILHLTTLVTRHRKRKNGTAAAAFTASHLHIHTSTAAVAAILVTSSTSPWLFLRLRFSCGCFDSCLPSCDSSLAPTVGIFFDRHRSLYRVTRFITYFLFVEYDLRLYLVQLSISYSTCYSIVYIHQLIKISTQCI